MALFSKFYGIGNQVGQHLADPVGIAVNTGRHIRVNVQDQFQVFFVRLCTEYVDDIFKAFMQVKRDYFQGKRA